MTQNHPNKLSARRVTLMASVAGIGLAVLLAGPGVFRATSTPGFTGSAIAAETMPRSSGFADIVAKVKPAVISIRVRLDAEKTASFDDNGGRTQPGAPFDRFFRQFGLPDGMPNSVEPRTRRPVSVEGSGFFISADGYAVTNNHVVDHAKTVQVVTDDGGTVTTGIVSARGRDIGSGPYDDYIQIDAAVNKGNSGGPSFNVNGDVIGVNTAIFSPSGGNVGIPADTVKSVVAQLKDTGHVTRGWMGVQIQAVTDPWVCMSASPCRGQGRGLRSIVRDMGPLGQATAERNVLAGDLVESDHEIIRRDSGGHDYPLV